MTIFRSMTPDRDSTTNENNHARRLAFMVGDDPRGDWVRCDECHGRIYAGSWPWCKNGNRDDHDR